MSEQEEEMIGALKAKINEYEALLEETMGETKSLAKVCAGPFENADGKKYYRVLKGNDNLVAYVADRPLFGTEDLTDDLKADTEIILIGQTIVSLLPEELKVIAELPEFDLISWDEIGGIKSQVAEIREAVELPINNAALAKELGVQAICGILLYGPPGCGKTLIAKAVSSTILGKTKIDPRAFIYIKGAELLSKYVGQTEQDIKNIFTQARAYEKQTGEKAVLFIDEAESLLPRRGSRKSSDVETTIVPTFLSEMSGFEGHNPIVILATNLKDNLDDAIIREGRIDIKIEIKRPTEADAREIFEIHLKKLKTHDNIADLADFATKALFALPAKKNVSGSMIEAISKGASRKTLTRMIATPKTKERGITLVDIKDSIEQINLSYVTKP